MPLQRAVTEHQRALALCAHGSFKGYFEIRWLEGQRDGASPGAANRRPDSKGRAPSWRACACSSAQSGVAAMREGDLCMPCRRPRADA